MRNKNQTAIIDWILQRDWELAITLTFKKDCTEHRARKTMRRLWNGIDRQLYQKAFKKQGKRVERRELNCNYPTPASASKHAGNKDTTGNG
jgi:hypothetical protein